MAIVEDNLYRVMSYWLNCLDLYRRLPALQNLMSRTVASDFRRRRMYPHKLRAQLKNAAIVKSNF